MLFEPGKFLRSMAQVEIDLTQHLQTLITRKLQNIKIGFCAMRSAIF